MAPTWVFIHIIFKYTSTSLITINVRTSRTLQAVQVIPEEFAFLATAHLNAALYSCTHCAVLTPGPFCCRTVLQSYMARENGGNERSGDLGFIHIERKRKSSTKKMARIKDVYISLSLFLGVNGPLGLVFHQEITTIRIEHIQLAENW